MAMPGRLNMGESRMLRMGRIAMGAGLVAATAAGFAVLAPGLIEPAFAQNSSKPITVSPPAGAPMSFADLIDKVSPAVVSVQVTTEVKASARNGVFDQFRGLPGFEEYEDRFGEGEGEPRTKKAARLAPASSLRLPATSSPTTTSSRMRAK
jgi:serine protease Do